MQPESHCEYFSDMWSWPIQHPASSHLPLPHTSSEITFKDNACSRKSSHLPLHLIWEITFKAVCYTLYDPCSHLPQKHLPFYLQVSSSIMTFKAEVQCVTHCIHVPYSHLPPTVHLIRVRKRQSWGSSCWCCRQLATYSLSTITGLFSSSFLLPSRDRSAKKSWQTFGAKAQWGTEKKGSSDSAWSVTTRQALQSHHDFREVRSLDSECKAPGFKIWGPQELVKSWCPKRILNLHIWQWGACQCLPAYFGQSWWPCWGIRRGDKRLPWASAVQRLPLSLQGLLHGIATLRRWDRTVDGDLEEDSQSHPPLDRHPNVFSQWY